MALKTEINTVSTPAEIAAKLDSLNNLTAENAESTDSESPETSLEKENSKASEKVSRESGKQAKTAKQVPLHEIPRFKEVVDEKNEAFKHLETAKNKIQSLEDQQAKLIALVENATESRDIVDRIRTLATTSKDERVQGAIDTLEKAMSGKLEAFEQKATDAVKAGDLTLKQANELVNKVKTDLEDKLDDQRADLLLEKAKNLAVSWLENLPAEYTDVDIKNLDELFYNRVDWNSIDANPAQMSAVMYKAFETALQAYGEPRGAFAKAIEEKKQEEQAPEPTDEEVVTKLRAVDWGKINDKGKPVISDDDFNKFMSDVLRSGRRR